MMHIQIANEKRILLNMREESFKNELSSFQSKYDPKMITEFFNYWSEPDKRFKMRFEKEPTWEVGRRLARWYNNQNKKYGTATIENKPGTSEARINAARSF